MKSACRISNLAYKTLPCTPKVNKFKFDHFTIFVWYRAYFSLILANLFMESSKKHGKQLAKWIHRSMKTQIIMIFLYFDNGEMLYYSCKLMNDHKSKDHTVTARATLLAVFKANYIWQNLMAAQLYLYYDISKTNRAWFYARDKFIMLRTEVTKLRNKINHERRDVKIIILLLYSWNFKSDAPLLRKEQTVLGKQKVTFMCTMILSALAKIWLPLTMKICAPKQRMSACGGNQRLPTTAEILFPQPASLIDLRSQQPTDSLDKASGR